VFAPALAALVYKLYELRKEEEERRKRKPRVTALYIYPIKACHGISLKTGKIGRTGFEYDRTWMIVDKRHRFITQRQHSKLATVVPRFSGDYLEVNAPGMPPLKLPLKTNKKATIQVEVWDDKVMAIDEGPVAAEWFSKFLRKSVTLVRTDPAVKRIADKKYWTEDIPGAKVVSFADGFPFLVVSQESVDFLNENLPKSETGTRTGTGTMTDVTFRRFRPNIVVRGARCPFDEDTWKTFTIRETVFHAVKDCGRCKVTTIDQDTGEPRGAEPLATLQRIRKVGDNAIFGQNVVHEEDGGIVCVGDYVDVKIPFHS